jgi:hypothetical protein
MFQVMSFMALASRGTEFNRNFQACAGAGDLRQCFGGISQQLSYCQENDMNEMSPSAVAGITRAP